MKLANLFGNHAVLQRDISVPVWGWTKPLAKVIVKVGPHQAQSISGTDGKFLVRLAGGPAGGGGGRGGWGARAGWAGGVGAWC